MIDKIKKELVYLKSIEGIDIDYFSIMYPYNDFKSAIFALCNKNGIEDDYIVMYYKNKLKSITFNKYISERNNNEYGIFNQINAIEEIKSSPALQYMYQSSNDFKKYVEVLISEDKYNDYLYLDFLLFVKIIIMNNSVGFKIADF